MPRVGFYCIYNPDDATSVCQVDCVTLDFSSSRKLAPDFEDFIKKSDWHTFGAITSGLLSLEKVVFGLEKHEDLSRLKSNTSFMDEYSRQSDRWKFAHWRDNKPSELYGWREIAIDSGGGRAHTLFIAYMLMYHPGEYVSENVVEWSKLYST